MSHKFTLRQLEIFIAIAQYGHVTKASEVLYLSQSAVSMALAELEKQLSQQLFDRVGKHLKITNAGQLLLQKAITLRESANEIEHLFDNEIQGVLRLGASSTIGNYVLAGLVGTYLQQYPQLKVELMIGNTEWCQRQLLDYQFDCVFIEGEVAHNDLQRQRWHQDQMQLLVAPQHPLAAKKRVTIDDLSQASWVLRESGSGTRDFFTQVILPQLQNVEVSLELSDSMAIVQVLETGFGIGCLSRHVADFAVRNNKLVALTCELDLARHFYLLTHRKKPASSLVRHFITFCDQKLKI